MCCAPRGPRIRVWERLQEEGGLPSTLVPRAGCICQELGADPGRGGSSVPGAVWEVSLWMEVWACPLGRDPYGGLTVQGGSLQPGQMG